MNEKKSVEYEIGFSDSEILSYNSQGENLIVILNAWNEKKIRFEFIDCILFLSFNNWMISDVVEFISSESSLLRKALKLVFEDVPEEHGYTLFQFLDLDGEPAIEVGCKSILISTIDENPREI